MPFLFQRTGAQQSHHVEPQPRVRLVPIISGLKPVSFLSPMRAPAASSAATTMTTTATTSSSTAVMSATVRRSTTIPTDAARDVQHQLEELQLQLEEQRSATQQARGRAKEMSARVRSLESQAQEEADGVAAAIADRDHEIAVLQVLLLAVVIFTRIRTRTNTTATTTTALAAPHHATRCGPPTQAQLRDLESQLDESKTLLTQVRNTPARARSSRSRLPGTPTAASSPFVSQLPPGVFVSPTRLRGDGTPLTEATPGSGISAEEDTSDADAVAALTVALAQRDRELTEARTQLEELQAQVHLACTRTHRSKTAEHPLHFSPTPSPCAGLLGCTCRCGLTARGQCARVGVCGGTAASTHRRLPTARNRQVGAVLCWDCFQGRS